VKINEVMRGSVIGKVIASKAEAYPVGTYATSHSAGWTEFAVLKEKELEKVDVPRNGRVTDTMGVLGTNLHSSIHACLPNTCNALGMTSLTAYFGILDVGKVKAGDFVVVSGAAGATGSVVAQIAKIMGATVLGIAGSDDKVQWLKDLGCDDALNYKDPNFAKKFRSATPVSWCIRTATGRALTTTTSG